MTSLIQRFLVWLDEILEVNKAVIPSFYRINTISISSVILFLVFIFFLLGLNKLVLFTSIIPLIGFISAYYLYHKKLFGHGLILVYLVSIFHASVVVISYDIQFLEVNYLFLAIIPWFPYNNLKLLNITYFMSFACFLLFGFHLKTYSFFAISQWPLPIFLYFILMNFAFIGLYIFLIIFKKNNLEYSHAIITKNKEIEDQNDLIKLNTKILVQLEKEKHDSELANKQKDVELLHINNQLKIKMKNDLIKELQKLRKKEADIDTGVRSIINKLKYQIEEEKKIDLLQDNIEIVSSDFHERIKEGFPDLSKSELELLSFIKLKMSNKQIAIQKNTSPNTINVAMHRLKTKCNFETTNELKDFIEGF